MTNESLNNGLQHSVFMGVCESYIGKPIGTRAVPQEWCLCLGGGGADPKHNCLLHRAAVQLCMRHSGLLVASADLFEALW